MVLQLLAAFVVLALALTLVVGAFLAGAEPGDPVSLRAIPRRALELVADHPAPLALLGVVAVVHHVVVNALDPMAASWIRAVTGLDFTQLVLQVEGDLVAHAVAYHWAPLTEALVYFYLVFHAFMLFFGPSYVVLTGEGRDVRTALLLYPVVYGLSLPFVLFFPAINPQVHFGFPSPLEAVIPGVEVLFYSVTTVDNTLPSLHVAMAVAIARLSYVTQNRRFQGLSVLYALLVMLTVLYLPIHWVVDVAGGLVVGWGGFALTRRLAGSDLVRAEGARREVRGLLAEALGSWRRE